MKVFKNLLILLVVVLSMSTLGACDFIDSILNKINSDSTQTYTSEQPADDIALLESHGYSCHLYNKDNLDTIEDSIHAESGTLKAWLIASDSNDNELIVYYLANSNDAQNCYNKMSAKSVYKVKGNKLIYKDTKGLFN